MSVRGCIYSIVDLMIYLEGYVRFVLLFFYLELMRF